MRCTRRWSRAVVAVVLIAAACGSDPDVVVSADGSTTTTTIAASTTQAPAGRAITSPTAAPPESTTTAPPEWTTTSTTTPSALPLVTGRISAVGHFHLSEGEFVKITEVDDPDSECVPGRLGVRSEGEVSHIYDDLGEVYGLGIFHGFFGQTAIVESCEESILRLLFATTAVPPPDGIPEIVVGTLDPEVFHLSEIGWRTTGLLHARATFFADTGWNDDVVFDAFDGSMRLLADALGERRRLETGIDLIVPAGWAIAEGDPALDTVELVDTATPAAVSVTVYPEPVPEPEPIGEDEVLRYTNAEYVELWDELGDGRARTSGTGVQAEDSWFSGPEGDRLVRTIELDDRTIRIVAHTPSSAGASSAFVPNLVLEHVRIFTAVG